MLDRVIQELANRQDQNKNLSKSIRDHLSRLHSDMMELRDSLNEAVNDTARAAELNNINQQTLEDVHVSPRPRAGGVLWRPVNPVTVFLSEESWAAAGPAEPAEGSAEHGGGQRGSSERCSTHARGAQRGEREAELLNEEHLWIMLYTLNGVSQLSESNIVG